MRLVRLLVLSAFAIVCSAAGTDVSRWLPPFRLDRVGHSATHQGLEADAEAFPAERINPIDLGAIFPPEGTLVIRPGQNGIVYMAALSYGRDLSDGRIRIWFESVPARAVELQTNLVKGVRHTFEIPIAAPETRLSKDALHVALIQDGVQQWQKTICVMLAQPPLDFPQFGAVKLKLRYDLPITVNAGERGRLGALAFLNYDQGWDPQLQDVVVCLPNRARWVFWRGSSYIPFWATKNNVGVCYEWAETTPPPDGVDCVEPLMDKELRYGRVEIVESTPARVHVRWNYQSTDLYYKVWGDRAEEDFYFYPDGFGTRVLTLQRRPRVPYELSEFIVLSPPGAYPLQFLPTNAVEMLYLNGEKTTLSFPPGREGGYNPVKHRREMPVIYCVHAHREDRDRAIYFHPSAAHYPAIQFQPFKAEGQIVTPAYWGSHWPLSRGKSTGAEIDDRVELSPAHNSLLTWGMNNDPPPLSRSELRTLDTLGRSADLICERWSWLIAMTQASDSELLDWARSFSAPPSIQPHGAQLEFDAYAPERRAIRLAITERNVVVRIDPASLVMNPVFELTNAPGSLIWVELNEVVLGPTDYAWDGKVLWLKAKVSQPAVLKLTFR